MLRMMEFINWSDLFILCSVQAEKLACLNPLNGSLGFIKAKWLCRKNNVIKPQNTHKHARAQGCCVRASKVGKRSTKSAYVCACDVHESVCVCPMWPSYGFHPVADSLI